MLDYYCLKRGAGPVPLHLENIYFSSYLEFLFSSWKKRSVLPKVDCDWLMTPRDCVTLTADCCSAKSLVQGRHSKRSAILKAVIHGYCME